MKRFLTLSMFLSFAAFADVGTFTTPVGDAGPGPALPGKAFRFEVSVRPGERLYFATMYGASNDWFFSTPYGLNLMMPSVRDVEIFDAGTEADENPEVAENTAPTQSSPDQGPADPIPYVRSLDQFRSFKASDFIHVKVMRIRAYRYQVTLEVLAGSKTPLSPGVYWTQRKYSWNKVFKVNRMLPDNGLERLAEDGNPNPLFDYINR